MTTLSRQHDAHLDTAHAHVACDHCRKPVPAGLVEPGAHAQFCCAGCRTAFGIINSCGLSDYYALLESSGDTAATVARAAAFAEFDDPTFSALYVRALPNNLAEIELVVANVHCGACLWLLERLPSVVPGVLSARLQIRSGLITVTFDSAATQLSRVAAAMAALGYPPHPAKDRPVRDQRAREDREQLIRIAIAGACSGNVMMLAFALYGGHFDGIEPAFFTAFRILSAVLGLTCIFWPGWPFFHSAITSIRAKSPNIDVPICIALLAGAVAGLVNTILDRGELYFDSLTMLVLLLLFGRLVGRKQQRWATDAVELLYSITPFSAHRVADDGSVRDIPADALAIGDLIEVRSGESVPVDGTIEAGSTRLDLSILSGESRPVPAGLGEQALAGAVNLGQTIRVRAAATGRDTRAGRLMAMVGEAAARRAPIIRFTDSIASIFILVVIALAALTFALWVGISPAAATDNAIAMLIVTCPCALGIAAPVALGLTIGRAARDGVLIKGADVLERLADPGTIVLDKTGTLTLGRPRIADVVGDRAALPYAAAVEAGVNHPLALAFAQHADPALACNDALLTLGKGASGSVNGSRVLAGSRAFLLEHAVHIPDSLASAFSAFTSRGQTPVGIAIEGHLVAVAAVGDAIREDAPSAIDALRRAGWSIQILSGDDPTIVRRVGQTLGIPESQCIGGVSPEGKLAHMQALASKGSVVMVGDGVNDAAALAAAHVGVAVHGGAEASLAAADVFIAKPGLSPLVELVATGPRALRSVRTILAVSVVYNVIAGALCLLGTINPIVAAAIMPLNSLSVLTVAVRSRAWRGISCR
jgi:Cu2+-exporting ATPase